MRIKLSDVVFHVETFGELGSPVLLVMGLGMPGRAWKNQVPDLARHHRVAWFDHRGSGKTEARPGLWSMDLFARDCVTLMDHLGWVDAHVVGVSMGGMIAQHVALKYRERVRSLSLIATHAGGFRGRMPTGAGLWRFVSANGASVDKRLNHLMSLLFPDDAFDESERARVKEGLLQDLVDRQPVRYRLSQLVAVLRHDMRARLSELGGVPTLVAKPGRDILVRPEECTRLANNIPGAKLVEFPNAGHGIIRQEAPALNQELLRHFAAADFRQQAAKQLTNKS